MQKIVEKILFILLLAAMLYQLPESLDKEAQFQDAVVKAHINHELSMKEMYENADR